MHTQMSFPGPMLHKVCAIHGVAGGESQDYPAFSALVQTVEGKQQQKVVFSKTLARAPPLYSCQPGGELMPACDYLGYHIYGKVTYEAILDTS